MSLNSPIPANLTISSYLLKNCKLWVWDFDDTLIDTTTYLKKNMCIESIKKRTNKELDNEVPQWRYFKHLVEFLVSHGRYVGIASFGTLEIIQAYMDRIMGFNQKIFNKRNIIAPCMKERDIRTFQPPRNKNEYIYKLMQNYKVEDFKRVVLFDDLPSNIADGLSIGIVAIQIAAPKNGDIDSDKMFFGPWVMNDFDRRIENDCGKEIYLNRTFKGVSSKSSPGRSNGYGSEMRGHNKNNNKNNTQEKKESYTGLSYDKLDFGLGVEKENYSTVAFGTAMGDRKLSIRPELKWNRMNVQNIPKWKNGNWSTTNISGIDSNPENWTESSLGGSSLSFWENNQIYKRNGNDRNYGNYGCDRNHNEEKKEKGIDNIDNGNNGDNGDSMDSMDNGDNGGGIIEGFQSNSNSNEESCTTCKKIGWNWITLLLMIIILFMIVIGFSIM